MSAIRAVLWDFGGVFTPSPFGAATAYAHAIGAEPAVLMEIVFGSYDTDGDHVWHRLERGEVSLVDALAEIAVAAEAAGFRFEAREMFAAMRSAKDHINIESYIIEDGEIGQQFAQLLLERQAAGVQVNVIYDSIGAFSTGKPFFERLQEVVLQLACKRAQAA